MSRLKDTEKAIDVPVLAYHQVEGVERKSSISPGLVVDARSFDRQMLILNTLGYHTISLDDLANSLAGNLPLPHRAIVITFDDGYAGAYQFAFPTLRRYGFTATLFLIAEDFAKNTRVTSQRAFPIMTHQQVSDMIEAGFQIGSHSVSHPRLTELSDSQVELEVRNSKEILEDTFARAVTAFCYPYGSHDCKVETRVAGAGYVCACTTRFGRSHRAQDRFVLKRIPVGADQGIAQFLYRLLLVGEH